jgi:hypothetical protein
MQLLVAGTAVCLLQHSGGLSPADMRLEVAAQPYDMQHTSCNPEHNVARAAHTC